MTPIYAEERRKLIDSLRRPMLAENDSARPLSAASEPSAPIRRSGGATGWYCGTPRGIARATGRRG